MKKTPMQQLHAKCEGQIIIAAVKRDDWLFVCKKCTATWKSAHPAYLPKEFMNVKKADAIILKPQ